MAALIWSHFLFNNWFYSTTVLFNCLFNFLFRWPPLFGRTFYSTFYFYSTSMAALIWSPLLIFILITTDLLLFFFFFFFSLEKKVLTWDSNPGPLDLQSGHLPLDHHHTHHRHLLIHLFIFQLFFFFFSFYSLEKRCLTLGFEPPHPFTKLITTPFTAIKLWASV